MIDENSTKEQVLAAVKQNGYALKHASEDLRNNLDIAGAAVMQDWRAIVYASDELKVGELATVVAGYYLN